MIDAGTLSLDDIVMRTIVDLPDEQIRALDSYSKKHGVSRAEAVSGGQWRCFCRDAGSRASGMALFQDLMSSPMSGCRSGRPTWLSRLQSLARLVNIP
jgi:hypothetical protein